MSDDPTTPTVLGGRYAIDRKLARGGMADIFLADDLVLERPVVIKTLLPQYAADPAFVERFRREATSAAKLNHANVVAVYDWGSHDDSYFMAMEYVEGQSLAEILLRARQLPPERAIEITSEAAAGLGFAHANGMVHRDVKPGNIMITSAGDVKVADFGVAKALDASDSLTQTGNVMGTAAYFSPEQARGEVVGPRSDLYALGVVLFEMVTGRRPFSGTSPVSIAYKHVGEAPPPASALNGDLPPAIDVIIATLLAKNPDDRYRDADHLRADLDRIRAGGDPRGVGPIETTTTVGDGGAASDGATRPLTGPLPAPPVVDPPTRVAPAAPPVVDPPTRVAPVAPPAGSSRPDAVAGRQPDRPRPPGGGNRALVVALVVLLAIAGGLVVVLVGALAGGEGAGDADPSGEEVDSGTIAPARSDGPANPATGPTTGATPGSVPATDDDAPPATSTSAMPTSEPADPTPSSATDSSATDQSSTEPPPTEPTTSSTTSQSTTTEATASPPSGAADATDGSDAP